MNFADIKIAEQKQQIEEKEILYPVLSTNLPGL